MLETIKLSKKGRDQLVTLKRYTKIQNWNVLCRWAFCVSLAEPATPRAQKIPADSTVEMSWKTFGGDSADVYWSLLVQRTKDDGLDLSEESLAEQFRLHLHRGIGYLSGDRQISSLRDIIKKGVPEAE